MSNVCVDSSTIGRGTATRIHSLGATADDITWLEIFYHNKRVLQLREASVELWVVVHDESNFLQLLEQLIHITVE